MNEQELLQQLQDLGQQELIERYQKLGKGDRDKLAVQIKEADFSVLKVLETREEDEERGDIQPISVLKADEIEVNKEKYYARGIEEIKAGRVGAVLLSGGQGTRLGFDKAKGMFDIGINKTRYIFEFHMKETMKVSKEAGAWIPFYIMTSEINYDEIVAFFEEQDYFGYNKDYVFFYKQQLTPAVDFNGKLLMEEPNKIAMSPNGNGGWYISLDNAGLRQGIVEKGIKWLNVFSVDNVLQKIADPYFIGATILSGSKSGSKVIKKADPHERVGVMCLEDGMPSVVEYYELTEEMAQSKDEEGNYLYDYGVILNYLLDVDMLEQTMEYALPVHVVEKKVPYVDIDGNRIQPEAANAYKFETLILDMVKVMGTCLPYEVIREQEFAPVKNKEGVDSVDTARELLIKNKFDI